MNDPRKLCARRAASMICLLGLLSLSLVAGGSRSHAAPALRVRDNGSAKASNGQFGFHSRNREHSPFVAATTSSAAVKCSVSAAGTDPQTSVGAASFPPAEVPRPGMKAESQDAAINDARAIAATFGRTSAARPNAAAVATEVAYSEFLTRARWPANSTINAQRCVWLVTVHAPIAVKEPPGGAPKTLGVYSVVIDVGSRALIALLEGTALTS